MKKVLILHSWFSTPTNNWYTWLKEKLEKQGYDVNLPDLPELRSKAPNMELILKDIEALTFIDKETIVIGHSIGSLLAMRLAEKYHFRKMILVSGWDFDDLTEGHVHFWKTKINHAVIKNNVKERVVVYSDNDPYFTTATAEDMSKRFEATFHLCKGGGHFTSKSGYSTFPQLLELF